MASKGRVVYIDRDLQTLKQKRMSLSEQTFLGLIKTKVYTLLTFTQHYFSLEMLTFCFGSKEQTIIAEQ